ncbi:MAG: hypothetical protein WCO09_01505 [bacterium]
MAATIPTNTHVKTEMKTQKTRLKDTLIAFQKLATLPRIIQKEQAINDMFDNELVGLRLPNGCSAYEDKVEDDVRSRFFLFEKNGEFVLMMAVTGGEKEEFSSVDNLSGKTCSWELTV